MPLLIWAGGSYVLGPYADGGAFSLLADFFLGLGQGSLAFWAVALGPYVLLLIARLFYRWVRAGEPGAD